MSKLQQRNKVNANLMSKCNLKFYGHRLLFNISIQTKNCPYKAAQYFSIYC